MQLRTDEIRRRRIILGWSQAELARRAGINQSHYSKVEKGQGGTPTPRWVRAVADALDVEVSEIVTFRDQQENIVLREEQ